MKTVTVDDRDHTVLRSPAKPIVFPLNTEAKQVIADLKQSINELGHALGLAATQIGYPWQVAIVQICEDALTLRQSSATTFAQTVMINPSYTPDLSSGFAKDWEGCFSVPGKMGEVQRFQTVHYTYYTENGDKVQGTASGLLARVIQHEVGHLHGQLYFDIITPECRFGRTEEMYPLRMQELLSSRK